MKKLAIIGGSYLQLPLVKKAKEMGIETHCFAWKDGAICEEFADFFYPISIREKELILKQCQEIGINGVVTIASDLAVLTVNYVAEQLGLIGNEDKFSLTQTDKYLMREALASLDNYRNSSLLHFTQKSPYIPRYFIIEGKDENLQFSFSSFPHIVKPTDRSGSRGVTKVNNNKEQKFAIDRAFNESLSKRVIVEEYIEGKEVSVESISFKGKHYILQITDKLTTGVPYFVELGHHQPSQLSQDIQDHIRSLVPVALDALHITNGASHTEIKITPDRELKIIEIGARMGGDFIGSDLVQLSTGYDFLKGVIQVVLDEFEEPRLTEHKCSGVYFLSEETPYISNYIKSAPSIPEIVKAEITDTKLHPLRESADRSGYFIYQSDKRFEL